MGLFVPQLSRNNTIIRRTKKTILPSIASCAQKVVALIVFFTLRNGGIFERMSELNKFNFLFMWGFNRTVDRKRSQNDLILKFNRRGPTGHAGHTSADMNVTYTVQLSVLGIDGITVSSGGGNYVRESGLGLGLGPDGAGPIPLTLIDEPVSAVASFSRGGRAPTTSGPSRPLSVSPDGFDLTVDTSESGEENYDDDRGTRHVAEWGSDPESGAVRSVVTIQLKLQRRGSLKYEGKEVNVAVGLARCGETVLIGSSKLVVTGPVPEMQFDLPLRPAAGGAVKTNGGRGKRHSILGRNSYSPAVLLEGAIGAASSFGTGIVLIGDAGRERVSFAYEPTRSYGLSDDATIRVRVSILKTKEYKISLAREQEAARSMLAQQREMARVNRHAQPLIIAGHLSNDSPISSISHTAFSSSHEGWVSAPPPPPPSLSFPAPCQSGVGRAVKKIEPCTSRSRPPPPPREEEEEKRRSPPIRSVGRPSHHPVRPFNTRRSLSL